MNGPLQTLREQAWQAFQARGLPTSREEDWKYTDLSRLRTLLGEQWWQPASADTAVIEMTELSGLDAWRMVFIDGRFDAAHSVLPPAITVSSLARMMQDEPAKIVDLLAYHPEAPLSSGLTAANSALASDGACICIPANTRLDKPLHLIHLNRGGTAHLRTGIEIGQHAEAEIIEHFSGQHDAAGLTNSVTAIRLAAGARCTHYRLQLEAAGQCHSGRVEISQMADSSYQLHAIELGGMLSRCDVIGKLNERGANCELSGLFVATGRQHIDHHTRIEHNAPYCSSRESYRSVLDGRAHGVFNGKIVVAKGAVKTDSAQHNANLLLSPHACIDTKPELEIYHDDVKCAHGVTVGQLDKNQLFYLKSRGIQEEEAKQMLTFAFADEQLARMNNQPIRRFIERAAFAKLPAMTDLEGMLA